MLSPEEMEQRLDELAVTNDGDYGGAGFQKFREDARGNSLSLSNLTVEALFSLGGGMSELWCRHVRDGKTVFVLVYFESSLMDSLPRMFAHGDRINSVTGTVAASIDRCLLALKEHNGGLNAHPYCGNAIWLVNPHIDACGRSESAQGCGWALPQCSADRRGDDEHNRRDEERRIRLPFRLGQPPALHPKVRGKARQGECGRRSVNPLSMQWRICRGFGIITAK